MNSKVERPTLQGQRIKTRKRDEKEKYDPGAFRDSILQGFQETLNQSSNASSDAESSEIVKNGNNFVITKAVLDSVYKFLDSSGSKLDYRRYGEVLFDIIIAGGVLAPGGTIVTEPDSNKLYRTDICVFAVPSDDIETIKGFAQVIVKIIRRFMYLEKTLEEEFKKIIVFLKGFSAEERTKLAKLTAILISGGLVSTLVLTSALNDHLVKDGIAIDFLITVFQTWLNEKDAATIWASLKRVGMDHSLMNFLPVSKRSPEYLNKVFLEGGLAQILEFQKAGQSSLVKKELQNQIYELLNEKASETEITSLIRESVVKNNLPEAEVAVLLWNTLMSVVEWNKKEDLVQKQALEHLKHYTPLMAAFATNSKSELALIIHIQEYCYENMNFLNAFRKIILLFYKADVLSEDVILKWYNGSHSSKGKSVFLDQMKSFIEWLENAEEESGEEA